jgi:ATP-dependent helicase/nuclease subunit B
VQARFLLGPAGSGKTFRCLGEIRVALWENPEGPPLILLAPKQATFQLERQLLDSERWGETPGEPSDGVAFGSRGRSPHQISGFTRLNIFSFDRLARFILDKPGIAPPKLLSDEGRVMVLRALLLRHADELKLFRGSARRAGFAQELGALLAELQQHQFTPAKLRDLAAGGNLRRELRDKLHDLALLHEAYANWLAEHELQDANRLLDFAAGALREQFRTLHSALRISSLWLDGFAEMTPQELDLLAAILPFCENATLAFCLENEPAAETSWLSIWSSVGKTFQRCRQRLENLPGCKIEVEILPRESGKNRFPENSALPHLEKSWAQPVHEKERRAPSRHESKPAGTAPGVPAEFGISNLESQISIAACPNPEAEAVFAAREILKFVRAGNRFRDCAILVRNLENYHKPLARVFRRYGIPFFLDRRESVAHHPLAELTRSALRTVAGDWRHDDWFAALKTGFCPVEETAIDRLENAALEFGWSGQKWREPLPDEFSERLRQKILPPFENFTAQLGQNQFHPTGAQLADATHNLWNDLKVEQTLECWSLPEPEVLSHVPRHTSPHSTVLEQMNLWLDNLALAFSREPLPLRDWLQILEAGLASLTIGVIPPVLDEVLIGAVDRARNPDLKLALVLGVNEGIFPAAPAAPAILTDADREELGQAVALGPDLRDRLSRERFFGYIACTRAREKLIVTFSRHDADGRPLNPSPFIAHLQRLFPTLEVEEFQTEIEMADAEHAIEIAPILMALQERRSPARRVGVQALACSSDTLKRELQPDFRAGPETGLPARVENWADLLQLSLLKSLLETLRALREPDPAEKLSPALAKKLFGPVLQTSVSRLEEFAQCPFKFFVRSGLHAGERKLFELDARERGSFQHEILKVFYEQLAAEGKLWRDLASPEARERISTIAAGLMEDFRQGLMRDTAQTQFEARAMTEALQDFIEVIVTWMRGQYEFAPAAAELDFGGKDSRATAWEIDLDHGRRLALQGRIDRVDLWRDQTGVALAVVMDYKSGGKKWDAVLVEHGVQLQLPAYLNALRHWKNPRGKFGADRLIPAGVFFVNLRGQFEGGKTRDEVLDATDARKLAYRHHGRFDAGALAKLDRVGAADQFNYRLNQDGSLRKGSTEALPRGEFEKMLDGVETRLKEMGRAIFSGEAKVDPYRKGTETPCEFCDYRAVCRINPWTHQWRVLRAKESGSAAVPAAS